MTVDSASLYRFAGLTTAFLSLLLIAAESSDPPSLIPEPMLHASPVFTRIEIPPGEERRVSITVTSPAAARLIAITTDCRCISSITPTPIDLLAGKDAQIELRAVGVLPGVKTVSLRTTTGTVRIQIQVVTTGLGTGAEVLKDVFVHARTAKASAWFIIHDLHGDIRNCGCSTGSLGGIDKIAALPTRCAELDKDLSTHFVLSGDVDGQRPGVGGTLAKYGWTVGDPAVVVTARPESVLSNPGIIAIIPTTPIAVENARLLRPLLAGGMMAKVLLVSAEGRIIERMSMPIDASLPSQPDVLSAFQDPLTYTIDDHSQPSQSCATCHSAAHKSWSLSAHARAWASLKEADKTDSCVLCHSATISGPAVKRTLAPNVQCASCHQGAEAHVASAGTVHTKGTTDCRSCHDARHDPGFNPIAAWAQIAHGK